MLYSSQYRKCYHIAGNTKLAGNTKHAAVDIARLKSYQINAFRNISKNKPANSSD